MESKSYPKDPREWRNMPVTLSESELLIGGWQVMQAWERPLMEVLAREVTANDGDILEVGFGMGFSANEIVKRGCKSYTVIEAHPIIAEQARAWAVGHRTPIQVIEGFWQEIVSGLDQQFDGILFDTYPLSEQERHRNHYSFIPVAPKLLRPNGIFTCYSDDGTDFRSDHLKLLLSNFDEVRLIKVTGLEPPANCEYWQGTSMVMPVARKLIT